RGSGLEPDAAAVTPVAAIGTSIGDELLAAEADATGTAVAALDEDIDLVDEHAVHRGPWRARRRSDRVGGDAHEARVSAPLELHDSHLSATPLGHDFAGDLGATEGLLARDDLTITVDEQDGLELDRRALFTRQFLDQDDLPGRHAVLLASGRDHGFHSKTFLNWRLRRGSMRPHADVLRQQARGFLSLRASESQAVFMYSASRLRTKSRERWTRDFTAGRLMPSVSAMSGLDRPSTSWST